MRRIIAPALLGLLAACGGDGSPGSGPTPTPTPTGPNTLPVFTSAGDVSVVENIGPAYQALVTDADNDPITVSISGGADAALFTASSSGHLTFRTPPNFDLPGDADRDNVYQVTLTASDGRGSVTKDVRITVTNSREGIAVRRVATGFTQPVDVYKIAGSPGQVYVVEKGGRIYRLTTATGARTLILTVGNLSTNGERGLLGLTIGPTSLAGGTSFYVTATAPDGAVQVRQYTPLAPDTFTDPVTPVILLSVPHATNSNHNGGWIDFGPDGQLYVAIGDGGGGGDPDNNAQNTNSMLGKILRLSLGSGGWGPSPANPFASGGGNPYVFAYGLRNPFRNAFEGDKLLLGDVGQEAVEEIDLLPITTAGANFGWPYREGTEPYRGTAPSGLVPPVLQYRHGTGPFQGASVIGGRVYRGAIASLDGHYLFADFVSKHLWSVPFAKLVAGQTLDGTGFELRDADFAPDAGTIDGTVSFGADEAGNIFIVDLDGEIFQIVPG